MENVVYVLCAMTSLLCSVLLWRGYRRTGARLLLWSTWCFIGLFANNVLLIVDLRLLPTIDLSLVRLAPALVGVALLIFGLVWETD